MFYSWKEAVSINRSNWNLHSIEKLVQRTNQHATIDSNCHTTHQHAQLFSREIECCFLYIIIVHTQKSPSQLQVNKPRTYVCRCVNALCSCYRVNQFSGWFRQSVRPLSQKYVLLGQASQAYTYLLTGSCMHGFQRRIK